MCLALALTAICGRAHAEGPAIYVERQVGAEACPDSPLLTARVSALRGKPLHDLRSAYTVTFSRSGRQLSATIAAESVEHKRRVLNARGPSCDALAQATALTLALLLDSDAETARESTPLSAPEPARASARELQEPTRATTSNAPANVAARVNGTFALGASALFALVEPISPAVVADFGIELPRFRIALGALGVLPREHKFGPGQVELSLVSGTARACYAPWRTGSLRFDLCSGTYFGVLSGKAQGYAENAARRTLWLSVPIELAVAHASSPLGWEFGAGALVTLRRHDFAIDNLGVAYDSAPVAVQVSARALTLWPW